MLYDKRYLPEYQRANMPRSKLEFYEDILNALAEKPLTVDGIAYRCNMNCVVLGQRLHFLMQNGLVEQNFCNKTQSFALTRRGLAIYKTLTIAKRLEKLQNTIKTVDEALRALPILSENDKEKATRAGQNKNY
jgi:predicted transcriptional regulator